MGWAREGAPHHIILKNMAYSLTTSSLVGKLLTTSCLVSLGRSISGIPIHMGSPIFHGQLSSLRLHSSMASGFPGLLSRAHLCAWRWRCPSNMINILSPVFHLMVNKIPAAGWVWLLEWIREQQRQSLHAGQELKLTTKVVGASLASLVSSWQTGLKAFSILYLSLGNGNTKEQESRDGGTYEQQSVFFTHSQNHLHSSSSPSLPQTSPWVDNRKRTQDKILFWERPKMDEDSEQAVFMICTNFWWPLQRVFSVIHTKAGPRSSRRAKPHKTRHFPPL